MSELPERWLLERLGEVAELVMGQAPPGTECNKDGLGMPFVKAGEFGENKPIIQEWTTRPLKLASAADVLICVVGATAGKINLGADCAIGRSVAAIRPRPALDQHFLHKFLSTTVQDLRAGSTGSAQGVISRDQLANVTLPIPPLAEQRRIVLKIDGLSAKAKRASDHLDHMPRLVKKYKEAILTAAFRGRLTENWRARNSSTSNFAINKQPLASICDQRRPITYGVIKLGSETPSGTPCLRTSNVRWLRVDIEGMKRISPKLSSEYGRTILCGGEVLVNVRGTLGGVAVATPSMRGWNVSREVAVIPVDTTIVEPRYAAYWIGSNGSQRWLNRVEKGVAYTGINLEDLRKLPVEFPSIDEQREIIHLIESAFAWVDRLALETTSARRLVDHLDQAILAKAFRGELVPQDANDEPASMLMERVRSERNAVDKRTSTKKQNKALR
jgi:type I restriction enzyme S subunit